jgi:MFS family permease
MLSSSFCSCKCRFLVVCMPFKSYTLNKKRCLLSITIILTLSLLIALIPLVGWSCYTHDHARLTGWISEDMHNDNSLSFYLVVFVFVYLIPLLVLLYTNAKAISTVRKSSKKFENNRIQKKKFIKEANLVKVAVASIGTFVLSYTPYLLVALARFITDRSDLQVYYLVVTLLARYSLLWIPLINLGMNKDINSQLFKSGKIFADSNQRRGAL